MVLSVIKTIKFLKSIGVISNSNDKRDIIIRLNSLRTLFIEIKEFFSDNTIKIILAITTLLYIAIISKIAEQMEARYIYCVYPIIALIFVIIADKILDTLLKVKQCNRTILLTIIVISITLFSFYNKKQSLQYFYPIDIASMAQTYDDSQFIMVSLTIGWLPINTLTFAAQNHQEGFVIYVKSQKDIDEKLIKPLKDLDRSKEAIIYIAESDNNWIPYWRPDVIKQNSIVKNRVFEVIEKEGFTKPKYLFSGFCFSAYRFSYKQK
jgi:hypothetical protein